VDPTQYRRALATFKDLGASGKDVLQCPFPVLGSQEALHGETYLSTAHVPVSGVTEQLSLGSGMLRPKAVPEKILKKLVEAEPLALGVEWDKEHRLMFELFEEELGLLQAGELPHQVGAERIDDRNAKQDSAERVWECFEHFAAQIVRHQAVIPAELGDKCTVVLAAAKCHGGQLQPSHPTFGPLHKHRDLLIVDRAMSDPRQELGRRRVVESEIALTELKDRVSHPGSVPSDRQVDSRRHHKMCGWWQSFGQATEFADQGVV
jgi:hypothetical protein